MHYYEHHLGDYVRDTAHLSMLEDSAYRRLLDAYYIREAPLPADLRECCKLARALSKPERDAVAYVLREFFTLGADGYRQARADREIARFQDKRERATRSANARWNRGDNTSARTAAAPAAPMRSHMRSHCDGNAPQAPSTNPQTPDTKQPARSPFPAHAPDDPPEPPDGGARTAAPTMAVAVCMALKAAGIAGVSPSHAGLHALLDAGAPLGAFVDAAGAAHGKGNPFAYVLARVRGQMADAARIGAEHVAAPLRETFRERDARIARERVDALIGRVSFAPPGGVVIDLPPATKRIAA